MVAANAREGVQEGAECGASSLRFVDCIVRHSPEELLSIVKLLDSTLTAGTERGTLTVPVHGRIAQR